MQKASGEPSNLLWVPIYGSFGPRPVQKSISTKPSGNKTTYRAQNPIRFKTQETSHFIEVHVTELSLFNHLPVETSLEFHHEQQHLVIRASGEQDLSCV